MVKYIEKLVPIASSDQRTKCHPESTNVQRCSLYNDHWSGHCPSGSIVCACIKHNVFIVDNFMAAR